MATLEAYYHNPGETLDYTPSGATTAGTVLQAADGSVIIPANDIGASVKGAATCKGVFRVAALTGATWSDGAELWWDESAGGAVTKTNALEGADDFRLGIAVGAKVSGVLYGYVRINEARPAFDPIVYEFDCQAGTLNEKHQLVPAEMNTHGLLILGVWALVTEVFAGGTEDQGIVTVYDGATSPNTICTLTPTNAGADALNDVVTGYSIGDDATGTAGVVVAAGLHIDAAITQLATGTSAAGKMKVYVVAVPLK
jgi:predicted RecA/RadA family phage recombinase